MRIVGTDPRCRKMELKTVVGRIKIDRFAGVLDRSDRRLSDPRDDRVCDATRSSNAM
jgi:hypothetical protein